MASATLLSIPADPTPLTADFLYDDANGERQEYDFYAWAVGRSAKEYRVAAALNHDLHPDLFERLTGKPLRFPTGSTYRLFADEE